MPLRHEIQKGIHFLLNNLNSDGGIPATKPGDVSGCWTTSEAIDSFLSMAYFPAAQLHRIRQMVEFLLKSQVIKTEAVSPANERSGTLSGEILEDSSSTSPSLESVQLGGWALVVGGSRISTMTTGHCVAALAHAHRIFQTDIAFGNRVHHAKELGLNWLHLTQNHDGGWGVEPESGPEGSESRMISVLYALRGYYEAGYTFEGSKDVRNAVRFICSTVSKDGGWGRKPGIDSDPSNTARAVIALVRSSKYTLDDNIIKRAIKFIIMSKPRNRHWDLKTETYIAQGAPGQTIYNSNTPFDVLEAFLTVGYTGPEVRALIRWFLENQEDDGRWYLGSNTSKVKDISTWSTSEAIYVLDIACKRHIRYAFNNLQKHLPKRWRTILTLLVVIILVEFLYITGTLNILGRAWVRMPQHIREIILGGVLLSIAVNILSNFVSAGVVGWFRRVLRK